MQQSATVAASKAKNALSHADILSVVERGAGMYERLSDSFEPVETRDAEEFRAHRIEEWKQVVAAGDEVRFQRRLTWDGLTSTDLHRMLGPVRLVDLDTLPMWATFLAEITSEATMPAAAEASRECCNMQEPIPFEDAIIVLVAAASSRLRTRCGKTLGRFALAAIAGLERALLRRLHMFFGDTLYLEYGIFRSKRVSSLDLLWMRTQGERSNDIYQSFIEHLLEGGLRDLCLEYPAMARLVATAIESWLDATADLILRLDDDSIEIASWLSPGEPLRVTSVEGLLSDSHHHGRWVSILTLSSGPRVVYKPRSVANEAAWFDLLEWLNRKGLPEPFVSLRVIERSSYGWMECISVAPLPDLSAARRFYRRCGALLALSYMVGVNDLHFENLIAAGENPILVDLETILCHSPIETTYGVLTEDILRTVFFESPLRTGLLPRWQTGIGSAVDVSGLGAVSAQRSRVPVPKWRDVNSDLMALSYETVEGSAFSNAAVLDGQVLSPNDYLEDITGGFRAMYQILVAQREELLAPAGPIESLSGLRVRFIFRATASYLMTMKGSRMPHLLRDGADRSIHLEPLAAPLLLALHKPAGWPLLEIERRSMEIEDCPHFMAAVSSTKIDASPDGIDGILEAPCFDQMVARLRRLSEEDLDNQLGLVQAAFDSRTEATVHAGPRTLNLRSSMLEPLEPLSQQQMLEEAVGIADSILAKSVVSPGRAPNWVTLRHLAGIGKNQLDPIGSDFFEGRAGVALMLASLFRVTGEARFGEAARLISTAIRDELVAMDPRFVPEEVLVHGLTGIASLTYVFPYLAEYLDSTELVDAARRAMRFLTPDGIGADQRYDTLSGSAGSILSLLRLGDDEAVSLAVQCAEHLLRNRSENESGLRCWKTFEDRAISGQAHGNAGIALALLRLFEVVPEQRFSEAALEAIAFEDSTFSETEVNWPDLRWEQRSFAGGWCHGGPGIALSRMEAFAQTSHSHFVRDIELAVEITRKHLGEGADHLCCGNFGRVLLLDVLGQRMNRPEWRNEACHFAAALSRRARQDDGYRFMRRYSGYVTFPGLFQGTSGVCYALLRLASSESLPSVMDLR